MKAKIILGEMTREQVRQVAAETVVVVPTASIEQHGPHLPVMTDTLACETVCRHAAEIASAEVSATVAPTLCFGRSHHHFPYPGVISLTGETFMREVYQVCESLVKSGFRRILVVNGHGGNAAAVLVVAQDLVDKYPSVVVSASNYWSIAQDAINNEGDPKSVAPSFPGHAGGFETSLVLALRPDLVDGRPPYIGGPTATVPRGGQRLGDGPGYTDDASAASAEKGEVFLSLTAREIAKLIVKLAES